MLDTILDSPLSQWLCQDTEVTDHIVISSRIRLARNFDDILFTNREDTVSLEKVNIISRGLLPILKKADEHQYTNISLEQLSQRERAVLVDGEMVMEFVLSDGERHYVCSVDAETTEVCRLTGDEPRDLNCNKLIIMQFKLIKPSKKNTLMPLMSDLVI